MGFLENKKNIQKLYMSEADVPYEMCDTLYVLEDAAGCRKAEFLYR